MKAVVVYESMYGNTHHVASAIGDGLGADADVVIVPVSEAGHELVQAADLLVVGGPTHVHGMSRTMTRTAAVEATDKPGNELQLEPDAGGEGLREWFESLGPLSIPAAAFDTRMHGPASLTGRASKGIAKRLRDHGASLLVAPESFIVTKDNHLEADEDQRARTWGEALLATASEQSALRTEA